MDPAELNPADAQPELTAFLRENPEWTAVADLILAPPDWDELLAEFPELEGSGLRWQYSTGYHYMDQVGITTGAFYWQMRKSGMTHNMSLMVAQKSGPGLKTDDTFFAGQKMLADEEDARGMKDHLAAAKRNGFTIPQGAVYYSNLARHKFDPEAYVTRAQGRSYIRKLIEKRGGVFDMVNDKVEWHEPEVDPREKAPN